MMCTPTKVPGRRNTSAGRERESVTMPAVGISDDAGSFTRWGQSSRLERASLIA